MAAALRIGESVAPVFAPPATLQGLRALVVDDNAHARQVLERLQRHGYFGGVPFAEAA